MTDFSLVLIDSRSSASFVAAEREALRGTGRLADVVYVRREAPGGTVASDPGVIVLGSEEPYSALIRAGAEAALCPKVAVLDIASLASFAGFATIALELHERRNEHHVDPYASEDTAEPVAFVAAQVADREGGVLFRRGALALDGTPRLGAGRASELQTHAPTLLCDPRAFAADRERLLASMRHGPMPYDDAASAELPWRIALAGGSAITSNTTTVVAEHAFLSTEPEPWKASLARLLEVDSLARTPEALEEGSRFDAGRVFTRLVRRAGLSLRDAERSLAQRERIQAARETPDQELFWNAVLVDAWPAENPPGDRRRRVAVLCSDAVGRSMAGPAIRSIELARALLEVADVRIAARIADDPAVDLPCPVHALSDATVDDLIEWADAFVLQGPLTHWHPSVLRCELPIAVDLYDPMNLEALESVDPGALVPYTTNLLHDQLWRGDYFFCASERQRDFWLGMLAATGRITPGRYAQDPDLDALIGIVPYGITDEEPRRVGPGVRAELGIGADDPLFVWNGGIWQWFDPDLLVLAIARLREELPNVRALFMGVRRPGSELTPEALRLEALIDEHGLRDTNVFVRNWTPYQERADTYLDATAVVSLHHAHIETRFSFRTRLLDCIWAATPVICTSGDVLAPVVRDADLGLTVPAGDLDAIVDALRTLATDAARVAAMREHLRALQPEYRWEHAAAPLVAWSEHAVSRRRERFPVAGLDPVLGAGPQLGPPALGLKALVPRPVRQHVLGPLKRRILQQT